MAEKGGYEVETFEAVGRKYKCHICMLIIRDPVQLAECGHRFCKLCIYSLVKEAVSLARCPIDQGVIDPAKLFDDKGFNREVLDIRVRCKNRTIGCHWVGKLRDQEKHVTTQCTKEEMPCQHENCNTTVFRGDLDDHMSKYCVYRTLHCRHCTDDYIYINKKNHENICTRYPLSCSNKCGILGIPRNEIQDHLSRCPLTIVPCAFANVGCSIQFKRKVERDHMKEYMQEHLHLTLMKTTQLENICQIQRESSVEHQNKIQSLELTCEEQRSLLSKCQNDLKTMETKCEEQRNLLSKYEMDLKVLESKYESKFPETTPTCQKGKRKLEEDTDTDPKPSRKLFKSVNYQQRNETCQSQAAKYKDVMSPNFDSTSSMMTPASTNLLECSKCKKKCKGKGGLTRHMRSKHETNTGVNHINVKVVGEETNTRVNHINLKVVGEDNSEVHYTIKVTTQLKKLKLAHADRMGVPLNSLRFLFDGQQILDEMSSNQLEMEEGDIIEVYHEQTGDKG